MATVVILDGEQKSSLSAVRSGGRARFEVVVGATRESAPARHSRFATRTFTYPDPLENPRGFIKALRTLLRTIPEKPFVYAFSDATHSLLEYHRAELEPLIQFAWNTPDALEIANNKAATYSEAKLLGVPTITTYLLENEGEVRRRSSELSFPVVVKPRHSVSWQEGRGVFGTATFVHSVDELVATFSNYKRVNGEPPLIQPLIRGEEYGVELLCREGEVVAQVVHHRVRSLSPTGGASVLRETLAADDTETTAEMVRLATKLANALLWHGPIMVEFKVDEDRRQPLLMEINGRFWGSLPLATAAGVDFPLLYQRLLADTLPEQATVVPTPGVVARYWLGDVRHLLRVLFKRDPMRPYLYPTRRKALRDFFRAYRGVVYDVWQWTDPLPALWQYLDVLKRK